MLFSLCLIATYFIGSIPTSLLISNWKGIDLRSQGSGNLGATNVYRVMGLKYALPVFMIDALKGAIPVALGMHLFSNPLYHIALGFIAVLGHSLSVFVKFKGGKGAATGLGVLLALNPLVFFIVFCVAFSLIFLFRYVAPVTIFCCILTPILLYLFKSPPEYCWFVLFICVLIIIRHHSNIKRMIRGEENRV